MLDGVAAKAELGYSDGLFLVCLGLSLGADCFHCCTFPLRGFVGRRLWLRLYNVFCEFQRWITIHISPGQQPSAGRRRRDGLVEDLGVVEIPVCPAAQWGLGMV